MISWPETSYNGGDAVTQYRINIKGNDGVYYEELTNCNGAVSTIIS